MLRVGVIGLGHWGPNLVRCFGGAETHEVTAVCDYEPARLKSFQSRYPDLYLYDDAEELIDSGPVDALVIATPTATHFELAKRALKKGKHVFVEKPLATSSAECQELIELANERERTLFVGHVFLHSASVGKLRELVSSGELGEVYYISSRRLNLGPVRRDVNALWDLAPHDISVMLDLMGSPPHAVSCCGSSYLSQGVQDVCNLTLHFWNGQMGIAHVSWLDPRKDRVMTIVGSRKMAVFDDMEPLEKIKVYDRGVDNFDEAQCSYRYGDMYSPRLEPIEPLSAECEEFISAILEKRPPSTDGINGLRVVEVLEAAAESLRLNGSCVHVKHWTGTHPGAEGASKAVALT